MTDPTGWKREALGLGIWEHRGKVAVAGIGHSPIYRRWDGNTLDEALGAISVLATQGAIEDAGVSADEIDGVISCPGPNGDGWAPRPYFDPPYDSEDGITLVTAEWLTKVAGLRNVTYVVNLNQLLGNALALASQAVGDGKCKNCIVLYPMGNIEGRYHHSSEMANEEASGPLQWMMPWGYHPGALMRMTLVYREYCRKYGKSEDSLAPLGVEVRKTGLLVPWGFYTTREPFEISLDDYLASRYIQKPLRMFDCDRPVHGAGAYLLTSAERALDMRQPPVYVLNHTQFTGTARGQIPHLAEIENWSTIQAKIMWEGSGLGPNDVDVFNPYDGYLTLAHYFLEGYRWHGVKRGEAFDFYAGDISVKGPHPFLSSGGNVGCGHIRTPHFHDSVEQLRGQAGERQITSRCDTAYAECGAPDECGALMFSKYPN